MLLTPILVIPPAAALLCLLVRSRRLMEGLNMLAFAATLALGIRLLHEVLARTVVTEWKEFFYADALSAWMVLLISAVSLATSLYAGRYFRRDLAAGQDIRLHINMDKVHFFEPGDNGKNISLEQV